MARRVAVAGLVLVVLLTAPGHPAVAAPIHGGRSTGAAAVIELATQTAVVPPGGTFAVRLRLEGVPDDGSVRIVIHERVRSRSELAASMDGEGLRSRVLDTVSPLSALNAQADGTLGIAVSLDPTGGGLALRTEGVYPVELVAQDPTGEPLASLVTHLTLGPAAGDESPSIGVAVVAELGASPALQPDGTTDLAASSVEAITEVVTGLVAVPDVPVTIAAIPETLDALIGSDRPGDIELVEALRLAARDRTVLASPYVAISPDSLAAAGLLAERGEQLDRGRRVLADALGAIPTTAVGLAPPNLGSAGLSALAFSGQRGVVVADDQVEPLRPGIISYSVAQPFLITGPDAEATDLQALSTDSVVLDRLHTDGSPGLIASRVLSEIALLRLEQPSVARSVVLPIEAGTSAAVVQLILQGLDVGRPFEAMSLDQAFDHAAPLVDGGDNPVERALLPARPTPIAAATATGIGRARGHLSSFVGLVGADSPRSDPLARHLLIASSSGISGTDRVAHLDAVEAAIAAMTGAVSTPSTFTLTLAARDGTVPLTITNDSGAPLHVSVRLSSGKLEFPDGDTIDLALTEAITRIDIPVRARASGAFPLQIAVVTPDGRLPLAMSRYTVRSTVVSGVGLILSAGAGLFLVVWWARHWRRTRRSAKLVAAHGHPAASGD